MSVSTLYVAHLHKFQCTAYFYIALHFMQSLASTWGWNVTPYGSVVFILSSSAYIEIIICLYGSVVFFLSDLRNMPKHRHDKLKSVKIVGFSSWKSLVELTSHILESTMLLRYLTLQKEILHPDVLLSSTDLTNVSPWGRMLSWKLINRYQLQVHWGHCAL